MKYNYVILGSEWDLYKFSYSDLINKEYSIYIPGTIPSNKLFRILYRIHFNLKINNIINLPWKSLWLPYFIKFHFSSTKPLCFIVFNNWLSLNIGVVEYLRNKYENCKIVWFCQDLISTQKIYYTKNNYDVDLIKSKFDLSISFDEGDCARHKMLYHPLVFSNNINIIKSNIPDSDIYFLGKAKDRLDLLIKLFCYFESKNLSCDFNIVGVKPEDRIMPHKIHYIESMSYENNLQHILHSKCLLEVMQKNGLGFTQRGCEAICLNKRYITNNKSIIEKEFFDERNILVFEEIDDITESFISLIKSKEVKYNISKSFSPIQFLIDIEEHLKKRFN